MVPLLGRRLQGQPQSPDLRRLLINLLLQFIDNRQGRIILREPIPSRDLPEMPVDLVDMAPEVDRDSSPNGANGKGDDVVEMSHQEAEDHDSSISRRHSPSSKKPGVRILPVSRTAF